MSAWSRGYDEGMKGGLIIGIMIGAFSGVALWWALTVAFSR